MPKTAQNLPGFVGKKGSRGLPVGGLGASPTLTIPVPNTPNPAKPDKTRQPLKNTGSYSCKTRLFPTIPDTFHRMACSREGETALPQPAHLRPVAEALPRKR